MDSTIKCPKCGAEINVEAIIGQQIEEKYKLQFQRDIDSLKQDYEKKNRELSNKEQALKEGRETLAQEVEKRTQSELAKIRKVIKDEEFAKAKSEFEVELTAAKERAAESAKQLQALRETQIENERLKRQLENQKADSELELEKKLAGSEEELRKKFREQLKTESEKIAEREAEKNEEQVAELKKQLDDTKKMLEEAGRKAEQRSQQLQGEIQELAVEAFLKDAFPFDRISEVKKGQYGADIIQVVRNSFGKEVGTLMYESKNTSAFSNDWLDKMKTEAADTKADILILITKTMPKGIEHTVLMNGVWVCPAKEYEGTARVLRESLIRVSEAYASQANKGEKMQMLYDYLMSGRFGDQIKSVISGFNELREGYLSERRSQEKIWKKRDAQLDKVAKNMMDCFTDIQVIGGTDIPQIASPEAELLALTEE